jgi:hypothetical protein
MFVVELDLFHLEAVAPLGLIPEPVFKRRLASSSVMKSSIASGS